MGSSPPHAESRDGADLLSLWRESYIWTLSSHTAGSVLLAVKQNKIKEASAQSADAILALRSTIDLGVKLNIFQSRCRGLTLFILERDQVSKSVTGPSGGLESVRCHSDKDKKQGHVTT